MVITNLAAVLNTEPCVVSGEAWVWGDMRENGGDELVWEFENSFVLRLIYSYFDRIYI